MDWEAYLSRLSAHGRQGAERLATRYGQTATNRHLRYHPVESLEEMEAALERENRKVRTQVRGLYESIDLNQLPLGWTVSNDLQREPDGTLVVRTDVIGPNGASGFFERGYNAEHQRIELRNAFLRNRGMSDELPAWVTGAGIPMVATKGTPTVQYFTLYQFKLLGVPAGQIRRWWCLLHRLHLRTGPFAVEGLAGSMKMSTIQNTETIVHLHWLRNQHHGVNLSELIRYTASVDYAETTAVQCAYRIAATSYVVSDEWEGRIGDLLEHFEGGNPQRQAESDSLLSRYSFDRQTVMKQNFDIELSVALA